MKRFSLVVLIALIAAVAIWYGLRVAEKTSAVAVTSLLPGDTLFFAHLPDFNRTRTEWHQTDLYQISREPAVRNFLQKPLSTIPKGQAASSNLADLERLAAKDVFLAITSAEHAQLKMAGGFRFKGSAEAAEKIIGQWRARFLAKLRATKGESAEYEQHHIETVVATGQTIATVYDRDWFLVANDLAELKTMIDRVDGRAKDRNTSLAGDATFAAAFKHMPSNYATLMYGRVDRYLEKLMPLLSPGAAAEPVPFYRKIHAFCAALAFDGSKVRDVLFIGMPKLLDAGSLSRASLALGTRETFFYFASFLNLTKEISLPPAGPATSGLPGILHKFAGAVAASGPSLDEWNGAFGRELGVLGDWPATSRWPTFVATLPIKDRARASQVLTKLTTPPAGSATLWTVQESDGVQYFSMQPTGFFSFAPALALTEKMLVAGSEAAAMQAAVKRSANRNSELAASQNFRAAERAVPSAREAFFYIDSALFYTRLDATLRPMLLMAAAFIPSINQKVDLNKFPPAEAITKHLNPIVMSQNYRGDGYVTESVGPVTVYQAAVGIALIGGSGMALYQHQAKQSAAAIFGKPVSRASPLPTAATGSPSPRPDETP